VHVDAFVEFVLTLLLVLVSEQVLLMQKYQPVVVTTTTKTMGESKVVKFDDA
jgi:hypothetical protein